MLTRLTISSVYVLDQQQALDFYCGVLGMEVEADMQFGPMRWLTVRVPGDPTREVMLELPGAPQMDPATAEQARELVSKGAAAGWLIFAVDDVYETHRELRARGVRIDEEPEPEDAAEAAVAAELDEAAPVAASDVLTLNDGTGPDTLGEQVDESDDDDGEPA